MTRGRFAPILLLVVILLTAGAQPGRSASCRRPTCPPSGHNVVDSDSRLCLHEADCAGGHAPGAQQVAGMTGASTNPVATEWGWSSVADVDRSPQRLLTGPYHPPRSA